MLIFKLDSIKLKYYEALLFKLVLERKIELFFATP